MKSNFVVWTKKAVPNACSLYKRIGFEKIYQLWVGTPRAADFPEEAAFTMHPDRPNDTLLTDSLFNNQLLIVGSQRLTEFFQQHGVPKIEYLPVGIVNHKGKRVTRDYFIINPIDPVDCIDIQKSEVKWDSIDPSSIDRISRLVIDETKLETGRVVFRPKSFYRVILVRRQFAELIDAQGFTGMRWVELAAFSM